MEQGTNIKDLHLLKKRLFYSVKLVTHPDMSSEVTDCSEDIKAIDREIVRQRKILLKELYK